jgi:hypothetical protein
MGRMVQAPINSITIGADAAQDLWSLVAASTNKIILHGWEITSDATEATLLEVTLQGVTGHGSSGSSLTAVKLDADDGAITASAEVGNTTPGTPGGVGVLAGFQWEQLGPLGQVYTPEMRPVIEVSTGIALTCNTADAFEMSGWICWEEI